MNKTVFANFPLYGRRKGQAAIFDGIMFLLFSSVSIALIFVFLNGYGIAQDEALRSAYVQAYLQDAAKSIFFIDVRTIAGVATAQEDVLAKDPNAGLGKQPCTATNGEGCPYWDLTYSPDTNDHCTVLSKYFATTVADLVKRDLSDSDTCLKVRVEKGGTTVVSNTCNAAPPSTNPSGSTGDDNSALVCLDNHFGLKQGATGACQIEGRVPTSHGKTALRCALKEAMKPLQQSGYYYFVEIVNRFPAEHFIPLAPGTNRITNYWPANVPDGQGNQWTSCNDVAQKGYVLNKPGSKGERLSFRVLTVSMPFRVPLADTLAEMREFILKICVWPGKN